jgi:hypothetical protein
VKFSLEFGIHHMIGFGGSSGKVLGAEALLKKEEEIFAVS